MIKFKMLMRVVPLSYLNMINFRKLSPTLSTLIFDVSKNYNIPIFLGNGEAVWGSDI
jgi:hypothetical protein